MSHQHHDGHNRARKSRVRLALSLLVTLVFVVFEALAGFYANSLALLTDAAHNATDVMALALSWWAMRLADKPPHAGKTFGYHRAGILVAMVNSSTLVVIAIGIFYESYRRLVAPPPIAEDILMTVGAAAFVVNGLTAWLVSHGSEHDLNMRSAFVHLMGDLFSSIGAMAAGLAIWLTGMNWFDPLASILIGLLIVWNAWSILKEAVEILLESTPRDIDMSQMVRDLMQIEGVRGVHDLHVWSISKSLRMLSAHIVTDDIPISEAVHIQRRVKNFMGKQYGIVHSTLQLECEGCEPDLLYCDIANGHGRTHTDDHVGHHH